MSRRLPQLILVLLLAVAGVLSPVAAQVARAADDTPASWRITDFNLTANAAKNGTLDITLDFTFDFADEAGHGPYVAIPERQAIDGDPDHWRAFTIDDVTARSASGAPADVQTETDSGVLLVRIGNENIEVRGEQQYQLRYRLSGIVNPDVATSGLDEINWNVVGPQWQVPIADVDVTITAPAPATRVACFTGDQFDQRCSGSPSAGTASTFQTDHLDPETPMQVVAGYPVGTFVGAEPQLAKRYHLGNVVPVTPLTGSLAGAMLVAGLAALVVGVRKVGRDRQYVDATYGYAPDVDREHAPTMAAVKAPVAVQFTPPEGVRPGELGTLTDESADTRDVTATLVDLAVRGYLRIEELPEAERETGSLGKRDDKTRWRLVQTGQATDLMPYEKVLYDGVFRDSRDPLLADLAKQGDFARTVSSTKSALHTDVTKHRHWFRFNPSHARALWAVMGAIVFVIGVGLTFALGFTLGLGLVGIAIALVGIGFFATLKAAPARTPQGVAMLQQALGFQLYLKTAEADQIRFEEGEDIFSRYLPYAIAWRCADRWAAVFAELARQGRDVPAPSWYIGAYPMAFVGTGHGSFIDGLNGFSAAAASTMTAASSGSSGGSGFSGGGGVGGGGGGGW